MAHFYLVDSLADAEPGGLIRIEGQEARHAATVSRIRTGAATGDTAVDRFTSRMLRRGREPAATPVGDP